MLAGLLFGAFVAAANGQTAQAPIQSSVIQNAGASASIHGVVFNATTNKPLTRALVQVEGQEVLTGYDGKFEFAGLSGASAMVTVRKPGFYEAVDPYQGVARSATVGSAEDVDVRLYPEALLTGTLSAPTGDPLAQIRIQALRRTDDESGLRWNMAGQATTNGDGQFRIPLPAGEYVVETQYMPERFVAHGAVLPIMVPAAGSNGGPGGGVSTMRLAAGTEQHLELRPPVRPGHEVHVLVESSTSVSEGQFAPQIQARLANGIVFSPQSRRGERQGEVVVNLPNGSYLLSASMGQREDSASYGETRVTVADEDVTGVTIHLQKALELTLETAIDPAATETSSTVSSGTGADPGSASFAQQLGIFLQRTDAGVGLRMESVSPMSRRGGPATFTLLPGSYRLRTGGYSQWFVESATAGGTDLLTQDLAVNGGSSSLPLRVVVSNQTATVKGTTRLGERLAQCTVTLIAMMPSASPEITVRSGSDGSFSRSLIPPGTYSVVASEARLGSDLTDSTVQRRLSPNMKTVTVGAGETVSVDLDAVPASEVKR